jgi:DNA invertase Pin-like site-specific DNA recombinase
MTYSDTASGKSMAGRPQLACALDDLDTGDELVIAEWDRATRSMWDGLQIIKAVIDAGAAIKVLDRSYIDLTTPIGRGFMAMMSAMAENERLRIIKRTHEGRQIARAKGVRPNFRCARRSWRDPAGASPAQVRGSARLVVSVASAVATPIGEAYTAIEWGGLVSRESGISQGPRLSEVPKAT